MGKKSSEQSHSFPGYFAIIPASVRYDPELRPNAKLLYGEITALASSCGYCFASNRYFADLYDMTPKSVSVLISSLSKRGHVKVELIKSNAGTSDVRRIWIAKQRDYLSEGIPQKKDTPPSKKGEGIPQKEDDNSTGNRTSNKTPIAPEFILEMFTEFAGESPALLTALFGFAEMRSKKKKSIDTERSAVLLLNKLKDYSGGSSDAMIELLDEATLNKWNSVYPRDKPASNHEPEPKGDDEEWK